jgi:transposase
MSEAANRSMEQLLADNAVLRAELEELTTLVGQLQKRIGELERSSRKSSKNSSMPPSTDLPGDRAEATKDRAARRAAAKAQRKDDVDRRRGKQPGAAGSNLAMRIDPDEIIDHSPSNCGSCGDDLADSTVEGFERRQVFDTPLPVLGCIEHRAVIKRCRCGTTTKGTFPAAAIAPASYGPNVRASALYLLFGQHLSVERTAEAISAMFGAPVSTGFVASLAPEASKGLDHFIEEIKRRLIGARLVHVDETSDQVRRDTWWFHVAANDLYTYLFASPTRGRAAPDDAGVLLDFSGVMVHDRLSMYFNYDQATHAICMAHVLRDLAAVGVGWDQEWANDMATLLTEMNRAAHQARDQGRTHLAKRQLASFLARYDTICSQGLAINTKSAGYPRNTIERDSHNLVKALLKLRTEATRFATDLSIPFSNNEAERSLRMAKLHRKISSCFQSEEHARAYATIRSYLATARKHGVGGFDVLTQLFNGDAWMPPIMT